VENNGRIPMVYSFSKPNAWQEIGEGDPILEKEKIILGKIKNEVDAQEKARIMVVRESEKQRRKIFVAKAVP
jgi:hypothetical protein